MKFSTVVQEVLYGILVVAVVIGNTLVIEAVRRNVRLRTISNICITSLAFADLLVGLINIPMYMYALANPKIVPEHQYTVQSCFDIYFSVASILNLTIISMDRCYAIRFPLRRRSLQKATIVKLLVILWIISFIPVCLFVLKVRSTAAILAGLFFLFPLVIMIMSYTILAITAKLSWGNIDAHSDLKRKTTKELKLAKTLCIVIVLFVVAWLPFFIMLIVVNYPKHFPMKLDRDSLVLLAYFIKILHHSNSAVNPIIYAFRQQEFANAFKRLLRCNGETSGSLSRRSTLQSSSKVSRQRSTEKMEMISSQMQDSQDP